MQGKKKLKINLIILLVGFSFFKTSFTFLDFQSLTGDTKSVDYLFSINLQTKKQQQKELEEKIISFKKRFSEANKSISKNINSISTRILELKNNLKTASDEEQENINKLMSLLTDRKENLLKLQELWKKAEELLLDYVKLLKDIIIEQQKEKEEEVKFAYSWDDFKQNQERVAELIAKLQVEKDKRESFKKQKVTEKETLISLQKQLETKDKQKDVGAKTFKNKNIDIKTLEQEINILNEKINYANLKIENLDYLIKYKDDEIVLIQYKLKNSQKRLDYIEKHMSVEPKDIEQAKTDWDDQKQKSAKIKEQLNSQKNFKKSELDKLNVTLQVLQNQLKKLESEADSTQILQAQLQRQKIETHIEVLNKDILLLDLKEERENIFINKKEQNFQIISSYQKISHEKESIDYWLANFKNQRDLVISSIKNLEENRNTQNTALLEINKKIDNLRSKEEEVKNKKDILFKARQREYNAILANLDEIKKNLNKQQQLIQEYLAVVSDLINQQETILTQYEFIINNLETKLISFNIWKRSPKAITLEESMQSLVDLEKFFVKFFWDIPANLSPSVLWSNIKSLNFYNYIGLLIFLFLYLLFFLGVKKIFLTIKDYTSSKISSYNKQKNFLYFNVITNTFVLFALNNYKVLFTWLFFYLHVIFDFKGIFASISFAANNFVIALFYLISVPVLIYIFSKFISNLKKLNKNLSFLFFAEKLQNKFIFLIAFILYATAVLIPIKKAFIVYVDFSSQAPNVIIAAYTLILVIAILLFFGKEDILTLIHSNSKFFVWLENKIDKYYYPVFIFFMGLLILSNPYIGYYNLAWYLSFSIPSSVFLIYGMFLVHYYSRNFFVQFFIKEEDDEVIDKFDHAKTYYGFFIITTFSILLFFLFILIARIWGFNYTPASLWKSLSQDWVLSLGDDIKFGLVQLMTVTIFIVSGFFISFFTNKFILNKLFEIFKTEPGTQNTIFRISHYLIIFISILLGFASIRLSGFILWAGGFFAAGLGFGLKDLVADFIAGFFVLIERSIEIGNFIQIDKDTRGTVRNISARATTIRTARNFSVIIPNKDLISKPIINWGEGRLAVGFELTVIIDYRSDVKFVKKLLLEIINNHQLILKVPAPVVRLEDFDAYGLKFFVRAFVGSRRIRDQWEIASDLRIEIISKFRENNIAICSPEYIIRLAQNENNGEIKSPINIKFD
ncbi:MAG: mechanosensitive ion channel domain-containing protein [Candidatus Babeliales bacterium]